MMVTKTKSTNLLREMACFKSPCKKYAIALVRPHAGQLQDINNPPLGQVLKINGKIKFLNKQRLPIFSGGISFKRTKIEDKLNIIALLEEKEINSSIVFQILFKFI